MEEKFEVVAGMKRKRTAQIAEPEVHVQQQEDIEKRFERFLSRPILPVTKRFDSVPIVYGRVPSLETWTDLQPGARMCYNLWRIAEVEQLITLGSQVFGAIQGDITAQAICQLMNLAYNLKDASGEYCFGVISPELILEDIDFEEVSNATLITVKPCNTISVTISREEPEYNERVANGFCYLATSYMRLYTKSAENSTRVEDHLRNRFTDFYGYALPFKNIYPLLETVNCIKFQIDVNLTLRNTFYNLVYAGESVENGKQLKEFLYGIHIAYTGMHCFPLFLKCMESLKVTNNQLINVLRSKYFEAELNALEMVFNNLYRSSEQQGMERQMWKYASVFNNRFFNQLQTKNSAMFTAVLAHLYHSIIPARGNEDARNIARVRQLSRDQLILAKEYARRALTICRDGMKDIKNSGE